MYGSSALLPLLLQASIGVTQVKRVDFGPPLAGADFLLVREASAHPAMRGRNLACYSIHVYDDEGGRRVAFVARRKATTEEKTPEGHEIVFHGQDPDCRSISFVMNEEGRVARIIHSRH